MNTFAGMSARRLEEILGRFPRLRVGVVGDFFLDRYLEVDGALAETSFETGLTAHQVVAVRHAPGAAGNVAANLSSLGVGALHAVGFTGEDGPGCELRRDLESLGCSREHLHTAPGVLTPTYIKPRDAHVGGLAGEHERYDIRNRTRLSARLQESLIESVDALLDEIDALIMVDQVASQECGVMTPRVREALIERARRRGGPAFWADSRARIGLFRGVTLKANQFEAVGRRRQRQGDRVEMPELVAAAERLRRSAGAAAVVTCGERGTIVCDAETIFVPALRVDGEVDITGAGDTFLAAAALAFSAGASLAEAALVGNLAASITIQKLATTGLARPEELPGRLETWLSQRSA